MQAKTCRHGQKLTAAFVILLVPLACGAATPPNSAIQPYIGDWVGQGWGWEERFRQSEREFVQQFPGAKSLPGDPGTDQTVMSLFVRHVTHYYFHVDEQGNVTGEGEITYDLFPNLCGVAALTKQVNEQVNMMAQMASIFKLATKIGTGSVKGLNGAFYKEESELANKITDIERTVRAAEAHGYSRVPGPRPTRSCRRL